MFTWFISLNNNMQALLACFFSCIFSIIGIFIALSFKKISNNFINIIISFSAGVLLASCCNSLFIPLNNNKIICALGILIGVFFLIIIEKIKIFRTNKIYNFLLLLAIHNIPEGLIIASTFSSIGINSITLISSLGILLSICLQNVTDGITTTIILKSINYSNYKTFMISFIICFVELISGIIGIFLINYFNFIISWLLAFSLGFILYMLISKLFPEYMQDSELLSIICIIGYILTIVVN